MGRGAVAEGGEEETEAGLGFFGGDAEGGEDPGLDVGPVDTDRTRAQLPAVEDQVVGLRPHGQGVGLEQLEVVGVGHGEGVVGGDGLAGVVEALEQRELHHPGESEGALVHRGPAEVQAQLAEDVPHRGALVGHHQHQVARLGAECAHQAGPLVVGKELGHRGLQRSSFSHP